jgi:hypothetical protein
MKKETFKRILSVIWLTFVTVSLLSFILVNYTYFWPLIIIVTAGGVVTLTLSALSVIRDWKDSCK